MAKFVMECPSCGKYVEVRTGFFAKKKIDCSCGYTINIKLDKLASRTCPHCGNDVVFDQSKGDKAKCPVCQNPINTMNEQSLMVEFSCSQCGVKLMTAKTANKYTCPVCDCENDVQERIKSEEIKRAGLASIIKYEGDADALIWKHPIEDFNMGSQLIVHESQEAIFFRNGQALDLFGAGRYTLETQQLPILEKLYKLPTDTEGTFHSEVYFINMAHQMAVKWGTPEKIRLIDPLTGAPISIGARGVLNFKVADSRKLLLKLVGTTNGLTRQNLLENSNSNISNYFRPAIQLEVSTHLADAITSEMIDILQIDQQKVRLSAAMLPKLQPYFDEFGIQVTEFLIAGIVLPEKGDLGYDSLQTIIRMRQAGLTKSAIQTETDIKLAEMEARKQLDIRQQQNAAEVEIAHRGVVAQKGETDILSAQYEGQRKVVEATGEVNAERLRMQLEMERKLQTAQIEAEEMRLKGYNQKDILQAEVQKAYAEGIGNMGPAISAGGGSSIVGDMVGLGVGMAAAGAMAPQLGNMLQNMNPAGNMPAGTGVVSGGVPINTGVQGLNFDGIATSPVIQAAADTWDCPACGAKGITGKFCPECGGPKPAPKPAVDTWDCLACNTTGITSKFCPECGAKKPETPKGWTCPACGTTDITSKFCPECGARKPEDKPAEPKTWDCPQCGNKGIFAKFCPECGMKRG